MKPTCIRNVYRYRTRLLREYKQLYDEPINDIYRFVEQEGYSVTMELQGPIGTIYENGKYIFMFDISVKYPFHPPKITCLTPIIHPNIYHGDLCVDLLQSHWTPVYTIHSIMRIIHHLLAEPDVDFTHLNVQHALSVSIQDKITQEHLEYKKYAFRYFQLWSVRRNFMMYLAGIGLISKKYERFPERTAENTSILSVLCNRCYLQQILGYL